ncbi:acyltransferase family protein [Dactylosporangium sp. NPDC051541]|uniref:acyltransferase family protein n=1 Tax=Dactylosporangium sp. NPDC051541 TaxID=3363977 RepID=UPI00378C6565
MRLYFVDTLRVLLIALVVVHHVAGVYSGLDAWYVTETPTSDGESLLLTLFMLVNQAWFMGAFFLLAGLFTPASYDRKGPRRFLRDRLLRLGVPFLVFYFVVNPLLWRDVHGIGSGPLWFVLALLIFDAGYAAFRFATRNRPVVEEPKPQTPLRYRPVLLFIAGLALATWALRIVIPIGFWVPVVDFPTAAYLPQYVSFFVVGIVAARRGWLDSLRARTGWLGLALALGGTLVFFPLALSGGLEAWLGRGTAGSLFYALWDSTFAVGLVLALLVLFRARFNREHRYLSGHVFTVYVIHAVVVTAAAWALTTLDWPSLAKFALGAAVAVPACFLLAGPVRRIPGVRRVL